MEEMPIAMSSDGAASLESVQRVAKKRPPSVISNQLRDELIRILRTGDDKHDGAFTVAVAAQVEKIVVAAREILMTESLAQNDLATLVSEQEASLRSDDPLIDPLVDVLHRVLGDWTGKLRVSDAYLVCGIEPSKVTQDQMERFDRAIRELGWERRRRRLDGVFDYAYVKGSDEQQRSVQLTVEYDHFSRSAKVIVERESSWRSSHSTEPYEGDAP